MEPYQGTQTPRRPAQRLSSLASVKELTAIERPDSRGSVNFSYPIGFREMAPCGKMRLTSPTPSSASQRAVPQQKQNLVYDPNTRSFLPESELLFYEQRIRDAAEKPVRRKKKVALQGATGSHLADGTVGGRIRGTAINATSAIDNTSKQVREPQSSPQPANTPAPRKKKKKKPPVSDDSHEVESRTPSVSDYDSDNSEKPMKFNTRAGMLLAKKPSIVREDREGEEADDDASKTSERQAALKKLESGSLDVRPVSPILRSIPNAPMGHGRGLAPASAANAQIQQQTRSASQPTPTFSTETTATSTLIPTSVDTSADSASAKPARVQSLSPVRNAHFLTAPESLAVKHQPPTRSISPRKSALKHSPSSRGSSPNGEVPVGSNIHHVSSLSETSDTSTAMSDERPLPKKKSVRVSFDDDSNVVLGQSDTPLTSDTPVLQSPQGKRGWFSGMGRGRKDLAAMDDNDDEIMKPRPALPSFGSVREKKSRDPEERPLVRPTESSEPAAPLASPLFTITTGEAIEHPLGQSSDHSVGLVLAHDLVSKNAANISKSREPLPPEVTSVEGSGYVSDSSSSIGTTEHTVESSDAIQQEPEIQQVYRIEEKLEDSHGDHSESSLPLSSVPSREESEIPTTKSNGNATIPSLALTRASPTLEETEKEGQWPYIIGGFPSSSDSGLDSPVSIVEHHPTDLSPSAVGIAEPEPTARPSGAPAVGDIAAQNLLHHPLAAEEDPGESDNSSIYSDAAEDLSDMQGDGFMSLDAVVDSPIVTNISGLTITTPPDSPSTKGFKQKAYVESALSKEPREPEKEEGWDKAQEYWSGLTAEKKKELERVAREETDESSEEELKPAPKTKKTKKVVVKSPAASPQINQPRTEYFSDRTYQIAPGAKAGPIGPAPIMRSSMRTPPSSTEEPVHMRRSMRDGRSLRGSMRGPSEAAAPSSQAKASLQKKYRPMSIPQQEIKPSPVEVKKHVKSMSTSSTPTTATTKPTPTLRRKGSAESDSSFKRARPATEGYSMKRSMRGPQLRQVPGRTQSPELPASTLRPSRFSLRSLSPTGSAYRDTPTVGLGRTLRNNRGFSSGSTGPTLRSPAPDNAKSTSLFAGFSKSKPQPKSRAAPTRASRFADSSDEEDARPSFRSRFVDSSDEEDDIVPATTATKSPISLGSTTRRTNVIDDDSSDLPDTDDEKPSPPSKVTKVVLPPARAVTPTHAGTALASGSLRRSGSGRDFMGATTSTSITAGAVARPSQKRRGSFMSILRRKKPDPASKVQKLEGESGARRDTPLERTRADLKAVRQDSNFSTASGATSPKLQKRGAMKTTGASGTLENWPLASPHPDTNGIGPNDEGPHTSEGPDISEKQLENGNGATVSGKPDLGPRRTTATSLAAVDLSTVIPPKKKKKFGMLRRAFRLDH